MLPLLGVVAVVAGFVLRLNPLLVVTAAALVTGLCAGMGPAQVIAAFGKAFNEDRYVSLIWLILPLVGLLAAAAGRDAAPPERVRRRSAGLGARRNAMIRIGAAYLLAGLVFGAFALLSVRDRSNPRRWRNTGFWGLVSASFLMGDYLGDFANGLLVLGLSAVAGLGGLGRGGPATTSPPERAEFAQHYGDRLLFLILVVPAVAMVGAFGLKSVTIAGRPLLEAKQAPVIALALGVAVAMAAALLMLKPKPVTPLQEGRRLADLVGWAAVLPQALAALGAVFALGGVGEAVGRLVDHYAPLDTPFLAVLGYTVGMAFLTALMGNAFAAFPVMTAAIGLPLIVHRFHGDPAILGAIGMLSGFSGTLVTPMAANFNLVPVALLELPDRWAVIRVQAPTALAMLIVNTGLMYALVYRF